jgi:Cd2+/Zn2+-exporting ATPase
MIETVYIIENLGCANCAAKMEHKIRAMPQVEAATITFATRQLRVKAPDPDSLLPELNAIVSGIEPEARVVSREQGHEHHHKADCHCGHDHHEHHRKHHHEEKGGEGSRLLLGAALFAGGIALDLLKWTLAAKVVFVLAYLLLGFEIIKTAAKNLVKGHIFDENFLMSIATIGAFFINEFPEAVGVMLFYRVGEYFEHRAVERSRSQIMQAVDLRPETVTLISGQTIPAAQAKIGDVLLVRPGDRIPLDGMVLSGESRIDTAPITGEPVPVRVCPGDAVTSGCVNTTGQLTIRVEKPLSQSMVTRILEFVEQAAAGKPKIDRFITRFARIYTPLVVLAAVAVAIVPSLITGNWGYWVYTALSFLVMSCPCALVLSVPLAFFSGIGVGSKRGILFKGGAVMEAMAKIKVVVMDKTGTVTKGDFAVQKVVGGDELLEICASCEQNSNHPIAESIVAAAKGMPLRKPDALEEIPGHGIRATLDGEEVLCGNEKLMKKYGVDLSGCEIEGDGTRVIVARKGCYAGYILISDTVKDGAADAVRRMKSMGVGTAMLTGDQAESARAVADAVGIEEVHAQLLPHEKLERLQAIRIAHGAAMFVGDGINDAPVLSGADVGAAMGSGADAAIEAADVVFLNSQVSAIPEALNIARRTRRIALQNVVFALAVKAVVMALGLMEHASMWAAVFADSGVAMLCVLNSIRMLYRKN